MALKPKSKPIKVLIGPGTAAYAWLDKPDDKFGDPKFKVSVVLDADSPAVAAVREACLKSAADEWAAPGKKFNPNTIDLPFKDGDSSDKEEWEGKVIINAKSGFKPTVVGRDKKPTDQKVFGGDEIIVSALTYPCSPKGQRTIALRLKAVMLVKKNVSYDASSDFDDADLSDYEDDTPPPSESDYRSYGGRSTDDDIPF